MKNPTETFSFDTPVKTEEDEQWNLGLKRSNF